jgi:peptidyl-tRNA hydrolase
MKSYFIIRRDLEMSGAKFGIQIGHGTDMIHIYMNTDPTAYAAWLAAGRRKIVLEIENEEKLQALKPLFDEAGIRTYDIFDYGYTEFGEYTVTGLVVPFPDEAKLPKKFKRLRLYRDD